MSIKRPSDKQKDKKAENMDSKKPYLKPRMKVVKINSGVVFAGSSTGCY